MINVYYAAEQVNRCTITFWCWNCHPGAAHFLSKLVFGIGIPRIVKLSLTFDSSSSWIHLLIALLSSSIKPENMAGRLLASSMGSLPESHLFTSPVLAPSRVKLVQPVSRVTVEKHQAERNGALDIVECSAALTKELCAVIHQFLL